MERVANLFCIRFAVCLIKYVYIIHLVGLSVLVESLKSLVIALAVTNRHITIDEAVDLSRLEINYQVCNQIIYNKFTMSFYLLILN